MRTVLYILALLSLSTLGYGQALPYNPPQMAAYWNPTGAAWEPLTSTGGGQALSTNPPPLAIYCLNGSGKWVPMDGTCIGGGDTTDGTVTDFTAGALSPLFNTSVATSTTTPALTFTISNAAQNSVLAGPASGGAGPYSFQTAPTFSAANLTNFPATLVDTTSVQTLTNKTVDGVTPTTFGFLDATSSIQTQLNGKQASGTYVTAVSCVTANGVSCTSSGGATPALTFTLGAITPTSTNGVSAATMAFMDATSSVQTQLNAKQASLGFTPAHSGANSDITSLTGLTTPLSVAQGGTGTGSTLTGIVRGGSPLTASEISGDCTTSGSNAITCTKTNGTQIATGLSIPTGTATFSGGTGITSVVCAVGYLCNNTRGTLTIVAAVGATTGTIATVNFSATLSAAPACFASQNGGSTAFGIGNSAPTTGAFNITAGISVSLATLTVNYQCQP
jgi:hypothetical protein